MQTALNNMPTAGRAYFLKDFSVPVLILLGDIFLRATRTKISFSGVIILLSVVGDYAKRFRFCNIRLFNFE